MIELAQYGVLGVITMLIIMGKIVPAYAATSREYDRAEQELHWHEDRLRETIEALEEGLISKHRALERSLENEASSPGPGSEARDRCEQLYKELVDHGWPEDVADGFYVLECYKHGLKPMDP